MTEGETNGKNAAFGWPGIPPRWTSSSKEGVGTAYSTSSRIWFTLSHGALIEVYIPTLDRPQIRDLQFLITDGKTFFHEEKRDLASEVEYIEPHTLGYRVVSADPHGRYQLIKEIIADPHQAVVLIHGRLEAREDWRERLRLYVLAAPHLEVGGWGNSAEKAQAAGREILVASSASDVEEFLALSPEELRSIGCAARERVLAQHTANHRSQQLLSLLEMAA